MNCELSLTLPGGRLWECRRPAVMGIVNVTPDSYYAPSRCADEGALRARLRRMMEEGADIIDIGACSTRPGSEPPAEAEEIRRAVRGVRMARAVCGPDIPLSIDTYRPAVAAAALDAGADIVNDVRGTQPLPGMYRLVAERRVPYILMHSRGTSATMQTLTHYHGDVAAEVTRVLAERVQQLASLGVADVIVDPGIGFAKTAEQCLRLIDSIGWMKAVLRRPVLVGLSRKSFICRGQSLTSDEVLAATTALHEKVLAQGASILRVHDVAEAKRKV